MNQPRPPPSADTPEHPHGSPVSQAARRGLQNEQGQSHGEDADEIADDKSAAAVFADHVRETPQIPQANGGSYRRNDESALGCPFRPGLRRFLTLEIHLHLLAHRVVPLGMPPFESAFPHRCTRRPPCPLPPALYRIAAGGSGSGPSTLPESDSPAALASSLRCCSTRQWTVPSG